MERGFFSVKSSKGFSSCISYSGSCNKQVLIRNDRNFFSLFYAFEILKYGCNPMFTVVSYRAGADGAKFSVFQRNFCEILCCPLYVGDQAAFRSAFNLFYSFFFLVLHSFCSGLPSCPVLDVTPPEFLEGVGVFAFGWHNLLFMHGNIKIGLRTEVLPFSAIFLYFQ